MSIWRIVVIKAIFFDLDGTLIDTHMSNYLAYNKALNEYGFDITYTEFQKSIGYQARTFLPWFAPNLTDDEYKKIAELKAEFYKETSKESAANTHLISHLKYLKRHHKIALVTTAKRQNAMTVLGHHNLADSFDFIITAEDVKESKPSPECYQLALQKCKVEPKEALAFEDSQPGIDAAESVGIPVINIREF